MPVILRSALVEHAAEHMFALVNDVTAYPQRFEWCREATILEQDQTRIVARLDLGLAGFHTWFTTENILHPPHHIEMRLHDGPFQHLHGRWDFQALAADACKVVLNLDFEPKNKLLGPAVKLGMQGLADRMVNDFVREAQRSKREAVQ